MIIIGGAVMCLAAFALVLSLATSMVPANWPLKPIRKADDPTAFRRHLIVWGCIGAVGAAVLLSRLL